MRCTGVMIGLLSGVLILGCRDNSSPPDPKVSNAKEKIKDAADATAEAARSKRDEYVRAMHKQLDELNVKYDDLKARAAKADDQAKKDLDRKLNEAKNKRDAAARKLDELKSAGVDRWEKVKEGVGNAFDDLKKVFE